MKLITILYVFLSVASLASATEGGTIRGGTRTIDRDVDDGKDLKKVKKTYKKPSPKMEVPKKEVSKREVTKNGGPKNGVPKNGGPKKEVAKREVAKREVPKMVPVGGK